MIIEGYGKLEMWLKGKDPFFGAPPPTLKTSNKTNQQKEKMEECIVFCFAHVHKTCVSTPPSPDLPFKSI